MIRPIHLTRLRIFTANIEYLNPVPALVAAIDEHQPDVVCIQQANPAVRWLHSVPGYRVRRVGVTAEAHDLAMLVRRGHVVSKQEAIRVPGSEWTGPIHGLRHGAKVFHGLLLDDAVRIENIHLPTKDPESNAAARRACFTRLRETARRHPHRPWLKVGDWNTPASELEAYAAQLDAHVAGDGIDVVMYRGLRHLGAVQGIARPAGTHGWNIHDFEIGDNR